MRIFQAIPCGCISFEMWQRSELARFYLKYGDNGAGLAAILSKFRGPFVACLPRPDASSAKHLKF
jgi:hypothetical protein